MNRGTGRTKDMVMSLPDSGAVVVVHSAKELRYVRQMIYDLKAPGTLGRLSRVTVIMDEIDAQRLRGETHPIFVDHAFWDEASPAAQAAVTQMVEHQKARRR